MTHPDDQLLDARLRDVPTPGGITGRVALEVLFDDAAIDRLLVRVDLPDGLQDRARRWLAAARKGSTLPLRTAPMSSRHDGRGSHGGSRRSWTSYLARLRPAAMDLLADGGAVAAALTIVAMMFFAGTELSRRLAPPVVTPQRMADRGASPTRSDGPRATADEFVPLRAAEGGSRTGEPAAAGGQETVATMRPPAGVTPKSPAVVPPSSLAPEAAFATSDAVATGDALRSPRPAGDAVEVRAAPAAGAGAGGRDRGGRTGGIRTVFLPTTGRQVPRVPSYDMAFEMAHGEAPLIDPSRAAALATDHPPLSLRTDSFDSLCEAARRDQGRPMGRRQRRGGMPAVRVEDVLAALPAAPGVAGWSGPGLGLSIDAVRSLRPSPGSLLVEVCVTAPPLAATAATSAPLDALLVLDQSSGPSASPSWQWLCRGLGRVIEQMAPADRLSLVVCGERPRLAALRADAATLTALLPELSREPMAVFADFDAAFRLVAAVGRREGRPERIVAAAHAGSLERCRAEGRAALSEWQAAQAAAPTEPVAPISEFVLIDPQQPLDAGGSAPGTAPAAAGRVAADPIAIGRGMLRHVFGRPTLVATGCRLEVAFDPARVGSYRIVGHRQTASDALAATAPRAIDLHAGETVRVVYEVIRRPAAPKPAASDVVSATLAWTPVDTGPDGVLSEQTVRRGLADGNGAIAEGLPSPHGCELLLAVAVGELAAASVHAEPWRQSAADSARLASRWRARGDLTPIGGLLIDCLELQGVVPDAAGR
jgi:hypothetical protein